MRITKGHHVLMLLSPPIHAARTILSSERGKLLFVRRSLTCSHLPGYLQFPGGKLGPGETSLEAAHREMLEEIGHRIATYPTCHAPYCLREILADGRIYTCTFYPGILIGDPVDIRVDFESSGHHWLTPKEILFPLDPRTEAAMLHYNFL